MNLLNSDEEKFLQLLLEQDWENDKSAYPKFFKQLPDNLIKQYGEIIDSLIKNGYIKKKYIRYFLLSPEAYSYFKDKKIYILKKRLEVLSPWIIAIIGWLLLIIEWLLD